MRKKKKRISIESYKSFLNNFKKKRGCTKLVLELKLKKYIYIYPSIDRALLPGIKRRGSLVTQLEGWTLNRCASTFRFCSRSSPLTSSTRPKFRFVPSSRASKLVGFAGEDDEASSQTTHSNGLGEKV